jgi:hypothetical protein
MRPDRKALDGPVVVVTAARLDPPDGRRGDAWTLW